jgi:hypothetical protein
MRTLAQTGAVIYRSRQLRRAQEIGEVRTTISDRIQESVRAVGFRRVIDLRPPARVRPASP